MTIYVGVVRWANSETENVFATAEYDKIFDYLKEIRFEQICQKMWIEIWKDSKYIAMEEINI